jgi:cysteine synthase A
MWKLAGTCSQARLSWKLQVGIQALASRRFVHRRDPLVIVMVESFSMERCRLMCFLGAKVVLNPASLKGSGMVAKAKELTDTHDWFLTRQFENKSNSRMHERTTAVEILRDFEGERLDYWVTGFGTGGTLTGVANVLKEKITRNKNSLLRT